MPHSTDPAAVERETARVVALLGDHEWQLSRVEREGPTMWWIALRLSISRLHELTSDSGGNRAATPLHN